MNIIFPNFIRAGSSLVTLLKHNASLYLLLLGLKLLGSNDSLPKPDHKEALKDSGFHILEIKAINDSWGGGYTPIEDDYRSFGLIVNYEYANKLIISSSFCGLTSKSWQDTSKKGRLDEFNIAAKLLVLNAATIHSKVYAIAGAIGIGKFLGDNVQYSIHNTFGVSSVSLPYENRTRIAPLIGLAATISEINLLKPRSLSIVVSPELETCIAPKLLGYAEGKIPLAFKSGQNCILFSVGYRLNNVYENSHVLSNVYNKEKDLTIEFKINSGRCSYFLKSYLTTGFSIGGFGIKLIDTRNKNELIKVKMAFEAGTYTNGYGYYVKALAAPITGQEGRLFFTLTNSFGTFLRKHLKDYPQKQGHYQQIQLGSRLLFFKCKNQLQLNPLIELGLGYNKINIYSGSTEVQESTNYTFALNAIAGMQLNFMLPKISRNTLYGITVNYNYSNLYTIQENKSAFSLGLSASFGL